jgi:stage II sporulation protein M
MPFLVRFQSSRFKDLLMPAAYVAGAFLLGLVCGALVLHTLNQGQQDGLRQYLDSFISSMSALVNKSQFPALSLGEAFRTQLLSMVVLWLLGLSVIGAPPIIMLVGARGFVLGFTVGFLVEAKAAQGLLLALVAVLPQNLCYVPALLGAGALALYFSLSLCKGLREAPIMSGLLSYSLAFLALTILVLAGSWIEAYLVPGIMRLTMLLS